MHILRHKKYKNQLLEIIIGCFKYMFIIQLFIGYRNEWNGNYLNLNCSYIFESLNLQFIKREMIVFHYNETNFECKYILLALNRVRFPLVHFQSMLGYTNMGFTGKLIVFHSKYL